MPQPRIAVFVLLILAIAGAALLWWPRDGSPPVAPPARNAVNAERASGSLDAPANDKSTAPAETGDAVRTEAAATEATAPSPKGSSGSRRFGPRQSQRPA